ncbi:MAG: L-seryl-tRNA(Sec) selenium transferase [Oscillospiraceae bacterium]|nr:L-seryl-tRNA(Sec) selenium transferase [Oscillospiraceae bacterium]
MDVERQEMLRKIPKVDELLTLAEETGRMATMTDIIPPAAVRDAIRDELEALRGNILAGDLTELPEKKAILDAACTRAYGEQRSSLRRVVNGTGVVLHTNLGRSLLSWQAVSAVEEVARNYSTLEYDVDSGSRGSRHDHIDNLLASVTGAEAAMVVNNNAAAVLLILSAMGRGGEVITSRGELVEIGGSFRIPEIMTQCGCTLREVGTTNKTHLFDYEDAIGPETRALLRVHTSNYRIVGFSERPGLAELVELGRKHDLPVIEDLGSGSLVDLTAFGIHGEPTVQQSVKAGVDVISFSGDKLLGGPQAGLILGKRAYIEKLKRHPLARALRVDKMTIAALRETLYAYQDPAWAKCNIPVLRMLGASGEELRGRAEKLRLALEGFGCAARVVETEGQVGGGSCPTQLLKSWAVAVDPGKLTADQLAEALRRPYPHIIGRISQGQYLLDVRTLTDDDFSAIARRLGEVFC